MLFLIIFFVLIIKLLICWFFVFILVICLVLLDFIFMFILLEFIVFVNILCLKCELLLGLGGKRFWEEFDLFIFFDVCFFVVCLLFFNICIVFLFVVCFLCFNICILF